MIKSILILGGYGKGNIGDELLRWITVKMCENLFPNISGEIFTYNPKVSYDFFNHNNFDYLNYYDYFPSLKYPTSFFKFKSIKNLRKHQLIIFGGGGFIYDYSMSNLLSWFRRLMALKKINKPILLLAIGIGPCRTGFSKIITRLILNCSNIIILRDYDSYKLAQILCKNQSKLRLGSDLVSLLNLYEDYSISIYKQDIKNCLVIPRPWPYDYSKKDERRLIDSFIYLLNNAIKHFKLENINFLPLHRFDDMPLCQRIAHELSIKCGIYKVRKYEDIKPIILSSDLIISMRYHGILLSLLAQKPIVAISYDRKVESLMKEFFDKNHPLSWIDFINKKESEIINCFSNIDKEEIKNIPEKIKELQTRLLNSIDSALLEILAQ